MRRTYICFRCGRNRSIWYREGTPYPSRVACFCGDVCTEIPNDHVPDDRSWPDAVTEPPKTRGGKRAQGN